MLISINGMLFKFYSVAPAIYSIHSVLSPGTSSEDTLHCVGSPCAPEHIRSLPIKPQIPFSALIPHANSLTINLLSQMLHFIPVQQITYEEALIEPPLSTGLAQPC